MKPNPSQSQQAPQQQQIQECHLDDLGYHFVRKCIDTIESRGLDDQGLYRIGGVNSRVARLLHLCLDRKNYNSSTGVISIPNFSDPVEWETKTITSALKNYLRNLSEPLMTYQLHPNIIEAAKITNAEARTYQIKNLIQQLPQRNFYLLKLIVEHLKNVSNHSKKNLMTVSNLSICFAPTLMRGPDENSLSMGEVKYSNVVTNTLIENFDSIFNETRLSQQQMIHQMTPNNQSIAQTQMHQYNHNQQQQQQQQQQQYQRPAPLHIPSQPIQQQSHVRQQPVINYNKCDEQLGLGLGWLHPNVISYRSNKVVTLYACVADTDSELSFDPNEIITDVRCSAEAGWLIGTLERNGQRGLLPENYVMFI